MIVAFNRYGEIIPANKITLAERLWKMKQEKPFWEVVEEVIKVFKKTRPEAYKSFVLHLDYTRGVQKETSVGNSRFRGVSKLDGGLRALIVDFPAWVMLCLKKLYTDDELQWTGEEGKKFYREFAKRFPEFKILERM